MANDDLSSDVTMATLAGGIQALTTSVQSIRAELSAMQGRESTIRAELTALLNREGIQNLSLDERRRERDERGWERAYRPFQGAPQPHNTKFSISRIFREKIFWLGAPSSKSLGTNIDGPMRSRNNSCMRTWRAPPWSRWWMFPSPDQKPPRRPWMNTSDASFPRATRSYCEPQGLSPAADEDGKLTISAGPWQSAAPAALVICTWHEASEISWGHQHSVLLSPRATGGGALQPLKRTLGHPGPKTTPWRKWIWPPMTRPRWPRCMKNSRTSPRMSRIFSRGSRWRGPSLLSLLTQDPSIWNRINQSHPISKKQSQTLYW